MERVEVYGDSRVSHSGITREKSQNVRHQALLPEAGEKSVPTSSLQQHRCLHLHQAHMATGKGGNSDLSLHTKCCGIQATLWAWSVSFQRTMTKMLLLFCHLASQERYKTRAVISWNCWALVAWHVAQVLQDGLQGLHSSDVTQCQPDSIWCKENNPQTQEPRLELNTVGSSVATTEYISLALS